MNKRIDQQILSRRALISLFGIITFVICVSGYWVFRYQEQAARDTKLNELKSIAELKTGQIVAWRSERSGDARINTSSTFFQAAIRTWLTNRNNAALTNELHERMELLRTYFKYHNVILADIHGVPLISLESDIMAVDSSMASFVEQAVSTGQTMFGDLSRDTVTDSVHLDIISPMIMDNTPLAVLILCIDPGKDLFPLIQSWPLPSKSAETLLVRRDGDSVLFLNVLRHRDDPALTVRIPLTRTDVPAVQAIMGNTGKFIGNDYNNVPVLAYIAPVPNTPWYMIAKVDEAEILSDMRTRGFMILFLIILAVCTNGFIFILLYNFQHRKLYQRMYQMQRKEHENDEEIRATLYGIGDGVISVDSHGQVRRMNPVAERLTGWNEAEAFGLPLKDIFRIVNEETREEVVNPVERVFRDGLIVGLANHTLLIARDGTERPIADSGSPIQIDDNISGVVLVFRDQTTERRSQQELVNREAFSRSILDALEANIAVLDANGVIVAVNQSWKRFAEENGDLSNGAATGTGINYLAVARAAQGASIEGAAEAIQGIQDVLSGHGNHFSVEYPCHSPSQQRWFLLTASPLGGNNGGVVLTHVNITSRIIQEQRRELVFQVLGALNRHNNISLLIDDILQLIHAHIQTDAIGIRLREGDDFPYYKAIGFSHEFVETEGHLCACTDTGGPILDEDGNTVLECICGRVATRQFDPALPCFTPNGSFWTNSTTDLLASLSKNGEVPHIRSRCNREGYESAAIIPLLSGDSVIGLLQLVDRQRDIFSLDIIQFIEGIGASIGIALARRQAAHSLQESEERWRSYLLNAPYGVFIADELGRYIQVNPEACRLSGYSEPELLSMCITDILTPEYHEAGRECFSRLSVTGKINEDFVVQKKTGEPRWWSVAAIKLSDTRFLGYADDITRQKHAAAEIRKNEERFRSTLDNMLEGCQIIDTDWRYTYLNDAADVHNRRPKEELLGMVYTEMWPGIENTEVYSMIKRCMEGRIPHHMENEFVFPDGSVGWFDLSIQPVPEGVFILSIDITERKQMEHELFVSRESLKRAQAISHVGSWEWNVEESSLIWSDELYHIYDIEPQTLLDFDMIVDRIHPDDREINQAFVNCLFCSEDSAEIEFRIVRNDGVIRHIHQQAQVRRRDDGTPSVIFGTMQDITERKHVQEAIADERILLKTIINNIPVAVYAKDRECRKILTNPVDLNNIGKPEEDVIGHTDADMLPGKVAEQTMADDLQVIRGNEAIVEREELIIKTDGESSWLLTTKVPWYDKKGDVIGLVGVSYDITERKKAEEERETLQKRLLQSQKLEAIGTLAGGIAHDFNNILTAILGFTELSIDQVPEESQLHSDLTKIMNAGTRARDLINEILAFSRQHEQVKRPILIAPIIKESLKLLRATIPSTIEIRQNIIHEMGTVLADPVKIHQVIINLCTNASQSMSEKGGILEISLDQCDLDDEFCMAHPGLHPGPHVKLKVSDTGSGIEPEIVSRIFEPYFTTKGKRGGSGLGLAMVHGIVTDCNGVITVYSEVGKGSAFSVYLPIVTAQPADIAEQLPPVRKGNERIMLIDDEQDILDVGKRILEQLGYVVAAMINSMEALELFQDAPEQFDLIITDMTMPFMTGDELATEFLRIRQDIPIIVCTGYSERLTKDQALSIGIRAFMSKPLLKSELAKTVRNVLDHKEGES